MPEPTLTPISATEAALERVVAAPVVTEETTPEPEPTTAASEEPEPAEATGTDEAGEQAEGEEPEGEESEEAEPEEDLDGIKAALTKHGAPRLEDLPEEARPLVEKRLAEMNKAFTRAQQEATEFRREKAEWVARKSYEEQHPVDAIVERLLAKPTLLDELNAELQKLAEPTYAEAKAMRREAQQDRAVIEAEQARRQQEFRETRILHVEHLAESHAAKAGIPFDLVEPAIAYAIQTSPTRDVTDEQVQQIIDTHAARYKRSIGAHKREAKKTYAKSKAADSKSAGLKVKPGSNAGAVAPSVPKALPKSAPLASRLEASLAQIGVPE